MAPIFFKKVLLNGLGEFSEKIAYINKLSLKYHQITNSISHDTNSFEKKHVICARILTHFTIMKYAC